MSVSREELETVIRRDCDGLHAWTNIKSDLRRFKECGWTLVSEDKYGASFTAPNNGITIRNLEKAGKREVSDEQKAAVAERMKMARAAKRQPTEND